MVGYAKTDWRAVTRHLGQRCRAAPGWDRRGLSDRWRLVARGSGGSPHVGSIGDPPVCWRWPAEPSPG